MLHCTLCSNDTGSRTQCIETFAHHLCHCCCQHFGAVVVIERTRKNVVPLTTIPDKHQTLNPHLFPFLSMEPPTVTRGQSTVSLVALPLFTHFSLPSLPSLPLPLLLVLPLTLPLQPSPQGLGHGHSHGRCNQSNGEIKQHLSTLCAFQSLPHLSSKLICEQFDSDAVIATARGGRCVVLMASVEMGPTNVLNCTPTFVALQVVAASWVVVAFAVVVMGK